MVSTFPSVENMIYKGLNAEDASFLEMVAKKKLEMDYMRFNEESNELKDYRVSFRYYKVYSF